MSSIVENRYDGHGRLVSQREGRLGEATCPVCGYPLLAIIWCDGEMELDDCDFCSEKVTKDLLHP